VSEYGYTITKHSQAVVSDKGGRVEDAASAYGYTLSKRPGRRLSPGRRMRRVCTHTPVHYSKQSRRAPRLRP